ncbi:MAG: KpsF/GutQ family sugar-phosphate isomerase [Bacteroidia bacterium]|nr:KpsF/GutQ family sugar-phosphate isomerase [Bacteroidia bacterium]
MSKAIDWAKEVIEIEARTIASLTPAINEDFSRVVEAFFHLRGKVAVLGMGKSGLIGRKIAATLSSTGTPAYYVHPAEAIHGDLGMISPEDAVLAISQSGETNEILQLLPHFKENRNLLVALTGNEFSTLALQADHLISTRIEQEACPLDLAPTASSTAQLVIGDALAIALMKTKNFNAEEFAKFHPGGSLGKRLVTQVGEIMTQQNLPIVGLHSTLPDVIMTISKGRLGLAVVMNEEEKISGLITDGDIRRAMENYRESFFITEAEQIMTANPKIVRPERSLIEAEKLMVSHKINSLLVAEKGKLLGVIQIYQIPV